MIKSPYRNSAVLSDIGVLEFTGFNLFFGFASIPLTHGTKVTLLFDTRQFVFNFN